MMDGEVDPPDDLKVSLSWPGDDPSVTSRDPEPDDTTETEKTAIDTDGEAQVRGTLISGLQRRTPATPSARTASRSVETPTTVRPIAVPTLPPLQGSEPQFQGRLDALAAALHGSNERLDGLKDRVITLRSFVNERLADVGDAVSRSQTRITEAVAEARSHTSMEIEEAAKKGQQSHYSMSASLAASLATSEEAARRSDRLSTDIANLGDSVAEALNQVADRLERLALTNSGRNDIVEVVAEALDDVAARLNELDAADRARHDRLVAAMTRLDARFADMALQREEHDLATQSSLATFQETVSRLAVAQAEDLERILDTVESNAPEAMETVVSLIKLDGDRVARIEDELRSLVERPVPAGGTKTDTAIGAQVAALSHQVEALRRRLAVRARPTPTAIDAGSLELLAEMVASRLRDGPDSPMASPAPKTRAAHRVRAGRLPPGA